MFVGLDLGGAYTVRRVDGEGPTVNVRAKTSKGRLVGAPSVEQVRDRLQVDNIGTQLRQSQPAEVH